MRILIVEDDDSTRRALEVMLARARLHFESVSLGEDGIAHARIYDFDLILLDLTLPDTDGHYIIRHLRMARVRTPVLIISGDHELGSKIRGLASGADDYVTKPFHGDELIARIRAIVRRARGHSEGVIRTGPVTLDLDSRTVEANGKRINLTGKEYQMYELLSLRKGTTLSKELFLTHLYGGMDEPAVKIIDVFMCKLRKKLAQATGDLEHIETIWGRGYLLRDREQPLVN